MTTKVILLNLAISVPAALVFLMLVPLVLRPGTPGEEGRADWRGPSRRRLWIGPSQRTAASIATATNSSAR